MNKQIFTCLILCMAWCVSANAKVVTRQQALQKARQFMVGKQFSEPVQRRGQMQSSSPSEAYYVFNAEMDGGFVIVAGDDRMPEILGYSEHGKLDMEELPDNLKGLLAYYRQVAMSLKDDIQVKADPVNRASRAAVAPLISTTWDQGAPYNIMCPLVGANKNLLTGCVATAMAQIINYHQWPQSETTSIPAYTTDGLQIFMPELLPVKFNWDNMDELSIARLMLYCGQSVQMNYGGDNGESGANPGIVPKALREVFGYSVMAQFVQQSSYTGDNWENLIYNELAEKRPVLYGGYGQAGHVFVVDGYENGMFHVNWGWSGNYDGYFLLTNLSPYGGVDFNQVQHAVIGIRPPKADDPSEPPSEQGDKEVFYGLVTIDGVSYDLHRYYNIYHAKIMPNLATGKYAGDIYVPDFVNYEGHKFRVDMMSWETLPFNDCDELTSLSIGLNESFTIANCPKLQSLELREGVVSFNELANCPALMELVFPRSLSRIGSMTLENVKAISFLSKGKQTFINLPFQSYDMPSLTDVFFNTVTPPSLQNAGVELNINPRVTIHVPQGLKDIYDNSIWKGWKIVDDQPAPPPSVTWGYFNTDDVIKTGVAWNYGENDAELAIPIPASEMALYKGSKITKIEYYSEDPEYVFITKPGTDYLLKQNTTSYDFAWNSVILEEPFVITGEEIYVGIGCHHQIGVRFADEVSSTYFPYKGRAMGNDTSYDMVPGRWEDGGSTNPIALRFVIESDNFPPGMTISDLRIVNNSTTGDYLETTVRNRSLSMVKSYKINWEIDTTIQGSQSYECNLQPGDEETVKVTLPELTGKNHSVRMYIATIDGEANSMSDQVATLNFSLSSKGHFSRRIIMEEGTGTWCAPCVRGVETISRLSKEYPDNFIAIVVHVDDEMSGAVNYNPIINQRFGSYPVCLLNRQQRADPSYPETKNFVEAEMNNGEAKIEGTAAYTSSDKASVTIRTDVEFAYDDPNGNDYQIAYVVVEDSVGPYVQKNDYSNPSAAHTDHYMDWWVHQDYYVPVVFNNVARGIFGDHNGLKGSIPETITCNVSYSYDYTFKLPNTIVDKNNIRFIVLLLNTKSDEILNAAECKIDESSGIQIIKSACRTSDVYNLKGTKVAHETTSLERLPKGIYIINGRKVVK